MILRLEYKLVEHPYKDELSSTGELWSEIKLKIFDGNNELVKVILDFQWNIVVFLDWINDNKEALLHEKFPSIRVRSSIAESLFQFYEELGPDSDSENLMEIIYDYRQRHGIRFALRGTDVDNIYIGKLNEVVTISLYDNDEDKWSFDIEVESFINDVQNALYSIGG